MKTAETYVCEMKRKFNDFTFWKVFVKEIEFRVGPVSLAPESITRFIKNLLRKKQNKMNFEIQQQTAVP